MALEMDEDSAEEMVEDLDVEMVVDSAVVDAVVNAKPFVMKNPKDHIANPSTKTATTARLTATTVATIVTIEKITMKTTTAEEAMPTTALVLDEDLVDSKQDSK